MKIYEKIILNKDGVVIEEKSYEYQGEVALCGKGGGSSTTYAYPPELSQMMKMFMPVAERLSQGGQLWDVPQAPQMFGGGAPPSYGVTPQYNIPMQGQTPGYDVPDVMSMMPSRETYDMVSPQVKAGLWAPYEQAQERLMETLGGRGALGSQKGGYSGAAGAAIGELMSRGAEDVGLNIARMTLPQLQMGWQAGLGREQQMWGEDVRRGTQQWGAELGREQQMWGQEQQRARDLYQRDLQVGQTEWGSEMERWRMLQQQQQMPYQFMPQMMGGATQPTGTTQQQDSGGFSVGGMLGGGAMGGLGASAMGIAAPWAMPFIGASALAGGLGGK